MPLREFSGTVEYQRAPNGIVVCAMEVVLPPEHFVRIRRVGEVRPHPDYGDFYGFGSFMLEPREAFSLTVYEQLSHEVIVPSACALIMNWYNVQTVSLSSVHAFSQWHMSMLVKETKNDSP